MGRRVSLPGAAELFRSTVPRERPHPQAEPERPDQAGEHDRHDPARGPGAVSATRPLHAVPGPSSPITARRAGGPAGPSQAGPHPVHLPAALGPAPAAAPHRAVPVGPDDLEQPERSEQVTVRLPSDLVLELERVRGLLARRHGLPVTRAEVVQAALGLLLEDYDAWGEQSVLVRRLSDE